MTDRSPLNKRLLVVLLSACNYDCPHCINSDEPLFPGYKLSYGQITQCLNDAMSFCNLNKISFSGGEPTLWQDGNIQFVDLLIEVSRLGIPTGFTTNGSGFVEYDKCVGFFDTYLYGSKKRLDVKISIDTFHNNFNSESLRASCLDNVIRYKKECAGNCGDLLNIEVYVTVSNDRSTFLPETMVDYYKDQSIDFRFRPLIKKGRARELQHVRFDSKNVEAANSRDTNISSGVPHRRHYYFILVGNTYYFDNHSWLPAGKLGSLNELDMDACFRENSLLG